MICITFRVNFSPNEYHYTPLYLPADSPYPLVDAEQHARYLLNRYSRATSVEYTDGFSSVKRIMEK